jgi:hypothetical protein
MCDDNTNDFKRELTTWKIKMKIMCDDNTNDFKTELLIL